MRGETYSLQWIWLTILVPTVVSLVEIASLGLELGSLTRAWGLTLFSCRIPVMKGVNRTRNTF